MPDKATIGELFEWAIATERMSEKFYRGLATMFAHCPEAAEIWKLYAQEEAGHARSLEHLCNTVPPAQLNEPADPVMVDHARQAAQLSVESLLANVRNLDDAYRLATEAETSETNLVFEFLITHFSADERARSFLRTQLKEHMNMAARFSTRFKSIIERQEVRANIATNEVSVTQSG